MKNFHWTQILGNPYQQNPKPEMLNGEYIRSCKRAIKGGSKNDVSRIFVCFDRDYLISWIAKKIVIPLGIHTKETSYNDFQKLIKESIDHARSLQNNEGEP